MLYWPDTGGGYTKFLLHAQFTTKSRSPGDPLSGCKGLTQRLRTKFCREPKKRYVLVPIGMDMVGYFGEATA